ncbi:MAG: haloacid dehalogenase-like hydrolase [Dehalococcoidaceae bacterium]|nr:haloacid dehalogenase-like hydrolase [Dehalococcoidaceae bacterium]
MKKPIAVFDLEGTLFKRNNHFMREITMGSQSGFFSSIRSLCLKTKLVMVFIAYKTNLLDEVEMRAATIKILAAFLKDSRADCITGRAKTFAAEYINHLRPEITPVLQGHKADGHICILFTGMPQPYVDAIKQQLGIDIALGTNLESEGDRLTGRLAHMPFQGKKRADKLAEVIKELDRAVDLASSFAYGDSFIDRYYMDMVGNPVAVYPDKKLAEYARLYGWRVIPPASK